MWVGRISPPSSAETFSINRFQVKEEEGALDTTKFNCSAFNFIVWAECKHHFALDFTKKAKKGDEEEIQQCSSHCMPATAGTKISMSVPVSRSINFRKIIVINKIFNTFHLSSNFYFPLRFSLSFFTSANGNFSRAFLFFAHFTCTSTQPFSK